MTRPDIGFTSHLMENLPDNAFVVAKGKLGQMIYENPGAGIDPRLEFFIEIAFQPFQWQEQELSPILRINGLVVEGARDWRALSDQSYQFPYAPKPGALDAGIHLFHVQNPADVTAIEFGKADANKLDVKFSTEVDFEIEADCEWEQVPLEIVCELEAAPLRIATSIEKRFQGDQTEIEKFAADLVDLTAYGSLQKVPGGFEFSL